MRPEGLDANQRWYKISKGKCWWKASLPHSAGGRKGRHAVRFPVVHMSFKTFHLWFASVANLNLTP